MSNSSSAVSKQWDPAITAFSTVDRLRGLVVATTKDNVQPSAVLAIERLGASLIVSPKLISDGVDALKGNESVRLADARLLLGLSWGGLAAQMRLSTACVRAFLLISALKICAYDDLGIAEIIYEYLSGANLLDLGPVSIQKLKDLVDVVSGHSNTLLPSVQHVMDAIIHSLSNQGPENWPRSCFETLAVKSIGEIFLCCFEAIQQDEGKYIELSGEEGLIWIATVLLWLCPDEVGFFSQEQCLIGATEGKVRIIVDKSCYTSAAKTRSSWRTRTWKAGKSIATIVAADDPPLWAPPRRTSARILKKNVRYYHLREGYDEAQLDLLGAIAAGLIDATLQFGILTSSHNCVRLKLLCEESFVQKAGHVMKEYGWEPDNIKDYTTRFLTLFSTTKVVGDSESDQSIIGRIHTVIGCIQKQYRINFASEEMSRLAEPAMKLAGQALASAQASFGTLVQFYYPNLDSRGFTEISFPRKRDCTIRMSWDIFVEQSYVIAGGVDSHRISRPPRAPVIFSSEGRVLFPRAMLDHSTRQGNLLALVVVPGRIHYEDSCFDSVVDVLPELYPYTPLPKHIRAPIFDMISRQLVLRIPYEQSRTNLQFYFAKDQGVLLMRTCLSSTQDNSVVDVSYPECIHNLANAVHVEKSKPPRDMTDICKELHELRHNDVFLTHTLSQWDGRKLNENTPQLIVTHVPNSQEVRFFASHPRFHAAQEEFLYILQGAEVIEALPTVLGHSVRDGVWCKLITGKDE